MIGEELIATLIESGVLTSDTGTDNIQLTESFDNAVTNYRETLSEMNSEQFPPEEPGVNNAATEWICDIEGDKTHVLPEFHALAEFIEEFDCHRLLNLALVVNQFTPEYPPSEGCPDQFIPIHGDRIDLMTKIFPQAIVYIWRHDCKPCELVKRDFDEIVTDSRIPMAAVYGPDWPILLKEEYNVAGGPTTLFFINGQIDMRLQGAYPKETLRSVFEEFKPKISGV